MFKVGIITDEVSMDFEYALRVIKEWEVKYIEIHSLWNKTVENLNEREVERAKRLIKKYQVIVSNISSTCFLFCPLSDAEELRHMRNIREDFIAVWGDYSEHLSYLKRSIKLAQMFETNLVRIFGFRRMNPSRQLDERILNKIVDKLREPAKIAEQSGITLILENCPFTYLGEGRLTSKILKKLNSKNIKLLWDPANVLAAGGEPYPNDYQFVKNHLVHLHIKDVVVDKANGQIKKVPVGKGSMNYREILQGLYQDEYQGVVSLETGCKGEDGSRKSGIKESLIQLREIMSGLDSRA